MEVRARYTSIYLASWSPKSASDLPHNGNGGNRCKPKWWGYPRRYPGPIPVHERAAGVRSEVRPTIF